MAEKTKVKSFVDKFDRDAGLTRKKTRLGKNQNVDDCFYAWLVQKRSEGISVSETALKLQAEKFHVSLKAEGDFNASDGWLWHWQKRYGIFQISISGEAKSSDIKAAAEFSKQFTISIKKEGYTDAQVYNCDETALYYRMLPSKTIDLKSNPQKAGLKLSKERITALFCVNKAGNHKFTPLITGKSQNPRCFKSINIRYLPVVYKNSINVWMTSNIFHDWFHNFFVPSVRKFLRGLSLDRKALLLLDNCPVHPPADNLVSDDGKIKVMYLLKNTTALIQPLDQGIISAFKTNYRREMMKSLLASDIDVNIFSFKKMNLKDVSYSIGLAWQAITSETIRNCWKKLNECNNQVDLDQTTTHSDSASDNIFTEAEISRIREILNEPEIINDSLTDWLDMDTREDICQNMTDEMIIESICGDEDSQEETDDDEESASGISGIPSTTKEAITTMVSL
ncbi:jerky protein homolog-like [Centruroides vittatus]|uniref:jerky protein homolog-like n=1 Tax=Centruroides vittatus TaxID=120091 RepID=UPI003510124E